MTYLLDLIEQYRLAAVFINVFLGQLGAPIPSYPILIITGALSDGLGSSAQLLLTAVCGALLADLFWFAAGRRYGRKVMTLLCRLSLSPDTCVRQTESLYLRWGAASLLVAKFVPGFASISSALAGTLGTKAIVFVLFDGLGAALWAGVAIALGTLFSTTVDDLLLVLADLGKWGVLLVALALIAYIFNKWLQRFRFHRSLRMARITVDDLYRLRQAGMPVTVVDVRPVVLQSEGRIPGAMTLSVEELAKVGLGRFDGEVVLYCACPSEASAAIVARQLMRRGFTRVRPLHGGIDAWISAGYALETSEAKSRTVAAAEQDVT